MHFADFVDFAGVIQNPLGGGRLAGVNVGGNPDVADFLKGVFSGHGEKPLLVIADLL
jgi:hypothetical protein